MNAGGGLSLRARSVLVRSSGMTSRLMISRSRARPLPELRVTFASGDKRQVVEVFRMGLAQRLYRQAGCARYRFDEGRRAVTQDLFWLITFESRRHEVASV